MQTTPDNRESVLEWLVEWLANDAGLPEESMEILRDIVERPDEHSAEIEMFINHDDSHEDIANALERATPRDWGYPADDWDDVRRVRELRTAGLSHMQAIIQTWKEKGLSHSQIEGQTGIPKGTIDTHSRRIAKKVKEAKELVATVESS